MSILFETEKALTDILCDSIIEDFEDSNSLCLTIPKNDKTWERVEKIIYKELLVSLNKFKMQLIGEINANTVLLSLLNDPLYTKDFTIEKISHGNGDIRKYHFTPNRYNVLTYIFYLNAVKGGELIISIGEGEDKLQKIAKPTEGKLVLFMEDIKYPYKYNLPVNKDQYVITGQLCSKNVI